jgi:hypothetical protein
MTSRRELAPKPEAKAGVPKVAPQEWPEDEVPADELPSQKRRFLTRLGMLMHLHPRRG